MLPVVATVLGLSAARFGLSIAERRNGERVRYLHAMGETMEIVIIAICVVFLVIRPFCAQAFFIPSGSMTPTLLVNDRLLVNKLSYRFGTPNRNEVIVFRAPNRATGRSEEGSEEFVKRVIGLPGDVIEVRNGTVLVNGSGVSTPLSGSPPDYEMAPYVVPPGKLFVLGDNRSESNDSHRWGALERFQVVGRAMFVFWPPTRFGPIR